MLAITGDAETTRLATETTLQRVWRSWPSVRQVTDLLVRARWTAVLVAAERESTAPCPTAQAVRAAVDELTGAVEGADGAGDTADAVVVAALQRLPRVQRRALVLHYMGGVSVRDLAALSGSSAEHIELLLDDGFTGLAASLDWSLPDEPRRGRRGPDLSFDWSAEVLIDTGLRLPERIAAPPPTVLLRHATVTHWSARVIPVAASAACAAVIAGVAQPIPPDVGPPAIYAEGAGSGGAVGATVEDDGVPAGTSGYAPPLVLSSGSAGHPGPTMKMRSVALTSLLDPTDRGNSSGDDGPDVGAASARISASHGGRMPPSSAQAAAAADGPGGSRASAGARPDAGAGEVAPSDQSSGAAQARSSSEAAGTEAGSRTAAAGARAAAPGGPAAPAAPLAAAGAPAPVSGGRAATTDAQAAVPGPRTAAPAAPAALAAAPAAPAGLAAAPAAAAGLRGTGSTGCAVSGPRRIAWRRRLSGPIRDGRGARFAAVNPGRSHWRAAGVRDRRLASRTAAGACGAPSGRTRATGRLAPHRGIARGRPGTRQSTGRPGARAARDRRPTGQDQAAGHRRRARRQGTRQRPGRQEADGQEAGCGTGRGPAHREEAHRQGVASIRNRRR